MSRNSQLFEDGMVTGRIPLDLILEILTRLPAKSVLRFNCVCKEWYNLINSPLFPELHHKKSHELESQHNCILYWIDSTLCVIDDLYHPVKVTKLNWPKDTIRDGDGKYHIGSCNGLVCFKVIGKISNTMPYFRLRCFLICNPSTHTFKSILPPSEDQVQFSYGFGYDNEHDDYKIVGTITAWREDEGDKHVFIYSLKTDLWSSATPSTRVSTGRCLTTIRGVIFENNMLHYLLQPVKESPIDDYKIARFDVVSEKWRDDLSLPVQVKSLLGLGNLNGRLYLHALSIDLSSRDIWMIEEDGSWKKMFSLPQHLIWHHLIARSKDGHHRLLLQDYRGQGDVLKWYDQGDNTSTFLKLEPSPKDKSKIIHCASSLIRIPGCSLTELPGKKEQGAYYRPLLVYIPYFVFGLDGYLQLAIGSDLSCFAIEASVDSLCMRLHFNRYSKPCVSKEFKMERVCERLL